MCGHEREGAAPPFGRSLPWGTEMRFGPNYSGLPRAMTPPFVKERLITLRAAGVA